MEFMKVIDQTVREIKREVNLKVLKVPEIEQKVLDATDDEPWGPHGTALVEIAQATKKFSECQMVMNVLWTRLVETGKGWRFVYKALSVIEYLVSHGSERAVDDIIEHTMQISSLTGFEYVEPSGKDVGLNVRKKAENIASLLNNREKIQEVRNKAASNRDKYFGLSSTGITYKSGSASLGGGNFQSGDRYGGFGGSREGDNFRSSNKDQVRYGEEKNDNDSFGKSRRGITSESQGNGFKKGSTYYGSKDQNNKSSSTSKSSAKLYESDKYSSTHSHSSSVPSNNNDDDFDDFDPRGTTSSKPAAGSSNQVDLFGQNFAGDLLDVTASVPSETSAVNSNPSEVDLFADATFVSASSEIEKGPSSQSQTDVDLFASQPAISSAAPPTVDFFATPDPVVQPEMKTPEVDAKSEPTTTNIVDPFASFPMNNFDESNLFGGFSSHSDPAATNNPLSPPADSSLNSVGGKALEDSKPTPKKDSFQVKSGVWADSLSRGLIDLNITAPKKASLSGVGIVGLDDGLDRKEKGPPASNNMARAMGMGSGLGMSGFVSSQVPDSSSGDNFFSSLGSQQYQFGGFKK
ncbi:ENTH/VHS family protein [Tripterygium wilfordii]|uniref:ENTH/VHS family protein n=1 Tax=Tripterygium wilfordii TaxID=458696 RepID=A0A7J7DA43_TRIWF|nr:clathrin interactor EPSIN 1-like [Tripterygium wilfordii]KAF5743213.1 ENTH/VHS family protein [Tripterygium wilfordii]